MDFSEFIGLMLTLCSVGILIILSSSNWWVTWVGIELFTLFFIPLMKLGGWFGVFSGLWHYYLIQSVSSIFILLIGLTIPMSDFMNFSIYTNQIVGVLMLIPVLMKLGLPPFHSWMLSISNNLSWSSFFFVNSLSKIGPTIILFNLVNSNVVKGYLIYSYSVMALLTIIPWVKEVRIRHLIVYSGVVNSCWTMMAAVLMDSLWIMIQMNYFISLFILVNKVALSSIETTESLYLAWTKSSFVGKLVMSFSLVNMAGMPPSPMFFLKVMVIWGSFMISWLPGFIGLILSMVYLKVYFSILTISLIQTNPSFKMVSWKTHSIFYFLLVWILFIMVIYFAC
nr:NADH dehydrogenase subunit 2 [Linognathus africanus]